MVLRLNGLWFHSRSMLNITLRKVSDRNSFRANQSNSKSFRNLFPNHSEKGFVPRLMKNGKKKSDVIRMNPNQSKSNEFGIAMIQMYSGKKFSLGQSELGFIPIPILLNEILLNSCLKCLDHILP